MASLDDLLQQIDSFEPSFTAPAVSAGSSLSSALTPEKPKSMIGADLLGSLDRGSMYPVEEPSIGDILYAAVPSRQTIYETGKGALDLAKLGISSGYDLIMPDTEAEAAAKVAAKAKQLEDDTKAAAAAGISLESYQAAKSAEKRNAILDTVGKLSFEIGGGVLGGLGGTAAGTVVGGASGSAVPVLGTAAGAGAGAVLGGVSGAYTGAGAGGVAYEKLKESIANYFNPGSVRPKSALEYAQLFEKSATPELLFGLGGAGLKAAGKGSAKAGQKVSDVLGPSTAEEALGRASGALEDVMPSAKVRGRYAGQAAREQTAGMKTTAEVLDTPEAYVAEQSIGLNPYNKDAYNVRVGENAVKSQEFLLDDLSKEVASKATPENVKLLKQAEVTDETAGRLVKDAIDKAEEEVKKTVSLEYAPLDLAETTTTAGVKTGIFDALKARYGTVPGATSKTGVKTERLSRSVPGELREFANEIRDRAFKQYTVEQLQRWQTRARNLINKYGNDEDAVVALTKIREILKDKILNTDTGSKYWANATETAKKAYDTFEKHKLGKMLERDRMNFGDFYKAIVKEPENFKNFKAMIQDNPQVLDAIKAKAISELKNIGTAAGTDTVAATAARSKWIRNNEPWLRQAFSPDELKRLNEMATRGESIARRGAMTNVLGGSPTATRAISSKYGLAKALKSKAAPSGETALAKEQTRKNLAQSLSFIGGGLAGGAGILTGSIAIPLGYLATRYGIGKIGERVAKGQELLRKAAYDIAMNPKTAGWTAPKLAKALAARRTAQVEKAGRVGEKVGKITATAGRIGSRLPTEEEKKVAQYVMENPDAYLQIDELLKRNATKEEAPAKPATPNVKSVRRVPVAKEDVQQAIQEIPKKYGVDSDLVNAIAYAESRFNPDATGPETKYGRAQGMMQLIPATSKALGVKDPYDVRQAVEGASKLLKELKGTFGGYKDDRFLMAAYNSNPRTLKKAIANVRADGDDVTWNNVSKYMPEETQKYVRIVSRQLLA